MTGTGFIPDPTVGVVMDVDAPPDAAVIVIEPVPTDVARLLEPAVLLIVATDADVELHVTDPVKFCVVLSEKVPVAVNCHVVPRAMLGLVGVTEMDTRVGAGALDSPRPNSHNQEAV